MQAWITLIGLLITLLEKAGPLLDKITRLIASLRRHQFRMIARTLSATEKDNAVRPGTPELDPGETDVPRSRGDGGNIPDVCQRAYRCDSKQDQGKGWGREHDRAER